MEKNPYSLVFGKEPTEIIPRTAQISDIVEEFCDEIPSQQVYVITGVSGSGKTVFMTSLSKELKKRDEWIVVEMNSEADLLKGLVTKLSGEQKLAEIFKKAKINLSFFGLGEDIEGVTPITDMEMAISKMLKSLAKQGKRVLVSIDEVSNTKDMRVFISAFQIFIRQDLPLFLIMTGLYENINLLQNEKNLTFFYRAPKVELKPLNISTISSNYQRVLGIDKSQALSMAKSTKGYSFAFQVLGHFAWKYRDDKTRIYEEYAQYLEDYVYEKIWYELSPGDKKVAYAIAKSETYKIKDIREILHMETNQFNPYRKRLIKKGIINGDDRGYVRFVLPLFENYVLVNSEQ